MKLFFDIFSVISSSSTNFGFQKCFNHNLIQKTCHVSTILTCSYCSLASAAQASKVVLVYFVGGYTLAEVAAFRLMQAKIQDAVHHLRNVKHLREVADEVHSFVIFRSNLF